MAEFVSFLMAIFWRIVYEMKEKSIRNNRRCAVQQAPGNDTSAYQWQNKLPMKYDNDANMNKQIRYCQIIIIMPTTTTMTKTNTTIDLIRLVFIGIRKIWPK